MSARHRLQTGLAPRGTPKQCDLGRGEDLRGVGRAGAGKECSIISAIDLAGSRPSMRVLREAYLGETRFDGFVRKTGSGDGAVAQSLRRLVIMGLLSRRPYRETGQRTRHEYVLTDSGRAFLPVMVALAQWAESHGTTGGSVDYMHAGCGARLRLTTECEAGHHVSVEEFAAARRTR